MAWCTEVCQTLSVRATESTSWFFHRLCHVPHRLRQWMKFGSVCETKHSRAPHISNSREWSHWINIPPSPGKTFSNKQLSFTFHYCWPMPRCWNSGTLATRSAGTENPDRLLWGIVCTWVSQAPTSALEARVNNFLLVWKKQTKINRGHNIMTGHKAVQPILLDSTPFSCDPMRNNDNAPL